MKEFAFPKRERLTDKRKISQLFAKAKVQSSFPLRTLYSISAKKEATSSPVKVTMAVPKRSFKRAVKRNLLKRRMREAYRLHKQELYALAVEADLTIEIVFIYLGKAEKSYDKVERSMVGLLETLHIKAAEVALKQPSAATDSLEGNTAL